MQLENVKIFSEYEKQFKVKYHGLNNKIGYDNDKMYFAFEVIDDCKAYNFRLEVDLPVNGDHTCRLYYLHDVIKMQPVVFKESRKPMEMNIQNAIHAAKFMIEHINKVMFAVDDFLIEFNLNCSERRNEILNDVKTSRSVKEVCFDNRYKLTDEFIADIAYAYAALSAVTQHPFTPDGNKEFRLDTAVIASKLNNSLNRQTKINHVISTHALLCAYALLVHIDIDGDSTWKELTTEHGTKTYVQLSEEIVNVLNSI